MISHYQNLFDLICEKLLEKRESAFDEDFNRLLLEVVNPNDQREDEQLFKSIKSKFTEYIQDVENDFLRVLRFQMRDSNGSDIFVACLKLSGHQNLIDRSNQKMLNLLSLEHIYSSGGQEELNMNNSHK